MKHFLYWIIGIVLAVGLASWSYRHISAGDAPTYQDVRVERGDLKITVMTTGTVRPQNRLEIKSPIAGRVEQALVKEGDSIRKGQILAWMSSTERAALLDAARAKGATELAYWEQLYKPTPLVAPLDGDIIARNIEPGQTVTASDVLYVMSDRLIIEAQVDETDIGRIAVGQPADITLDAYPQEAITGRVDQIAYEAKTVNNVTTYTVEVLPSPAPSFLRSGMTANLKVLTAVTNQVLLLPTAAVRLEKNQTVVWRLNPSDSARGGSASGGKKKPVSIPVVTGLTDGKQTEIRSGLQEGDLALVKAPKAASKDTQVQRNPFLPGRRR